MLLLVISLCGINGGASWAKPPRRSGGRSSVPPTCPALAQRVDTLRHRGVLRQGVTAVLAVRAKTGAVLYAAHADRQLIPASNTKLVSTGTALAVLGPRWRYTTLVIGPAPDEAGHIEGDLSVVGSGDPTLDEAGLEDLASKLAERGVRAVDGDVLVGPGVRLPKPAEGGVEAALEHSLARANIEVSGRVCRRHPTWSHSRQAERGQELLRHRSMPLSHLLQRINRPSNNRLAEALLRTTGAVLWGGRPTPGKGVRAMRWWLRRRAGLRNATPYVADGSGLSRRTRMSPRQIVRILRVLLGFVGPRDATARHHASVFRASLPVAGRNGTLRFRFRRSPVAGRLRAKTGTLEHVIALSGELERPHGGAVIFSILTNGTKHSDRYRVRRAHERIVGALYRSRCSPTLR